MNMKAKTLVALAALAALLYGCGSGGAYTLRLKPKQGEKHTFVVTTNTGGQTSTTEAVVECTKVEGDKVTMATTVNGVTSTSVMDATGKVVESSVPSSATVGFPTNPVKVGDTWEATTKMAGKDVQAKVKLAKVEGNAATLETTIGSIDPNLQIVGPIVSVIDVDTGMTISTHVEMKITPPGSKEMTMTSDTKRK